MVRKGQEGSGRLRKGQEGLGSPRAGVPEGLFQGYKTLLCAGLETDDNEISFGCSIRRLGDTSEDTGDLQL